jgi:hypothetical protein
MAKGQMRSNKEVRKPKADKKAKAAPAPGPFANANAPAGTEKKGKKG